MDIEEVMLDAEERMDKSLRHYQEELSRIRTGKASTGMVEDVEINLYGTMMPLKQAANILAPEPRLIVIQPYDKSAIPAIEKAILQSDLGLNPVNDGTVVRIAVPQLTEERRKEIVKVVHNKAEEARTAVRQIRRDANDNIKKLKEEGEIPEDNMYRRLDEVQKMTDEHIEKIDAVMEEKEKEVLEI
jgi:ribosome recycling factor